MLIFGIFVAALLAGRNALPRPGRKNLNSEIRVSSKKRRTHKSRKTPFFCNFITDFKGATFRRFPLAYTSRHPKACGFRLNLDIALNRSPFVWRTSSPSFLLLVRLGLRLAKASGPATRLPVAGTLPPLPCNCTRG